MPILASFFCLSLHGKLTSIIIMRKSLFLTTMFLLFSFMGFAQEWHGITSDSPTKMKQTLVSSTEKEIVVDVQIGGFYTQNVKTPNGKQVVVSVDKMAAMLQAGAPDLPMAPISVIIGDQAEMQVNVVKSSYVDFENVEVAPSKGNFSRQIDPEDVPYTYGEMYQQNAFWPATQAYLEAPYILRDFRGQNIMVRPFAYNPVTKTLRVYTQMTIAMTKVSDNGENQKAARKSNTIKVDPEMKAAYERRFINFGETEAKYTFVADQGTMLVIAADQFASAMEPFVEWKNISGRPCTLATVTEVGGNNETSIKDYIQNLYQNDNLEFVLFVGDYNHITPHSMSGGRSDNWFVQLEGNDYYVEAFIGRFSVESVADVENHVNKVLNYERNLQSNVSWVNKGLGIGYVGAGTGHYGEDDYQHIDFIRDTLMHYTYGTVTEHHGGSGGTASTTTISNTINDGVSIINYCNHGSETSWGVANYSVSNVNALVNDNMLPIIWSVACLNGQFNYNGQCFAEAWMRATNNSTGEPTGAIGGMFSWISQPWVPPMYGQDEMVRILTEWVGGENYHHTLGGTSLNGNMYILDMAPSDNGATHNTWILFGDPSLMVRTDNPEEMSVTLSPAAPMVGMSSLTVNADAEYGIATISTEDGEIYASARLVNGQAELTFAPFPTVGTYNLVVMGYNKVTYIGTLEVLPAEGAYISVEEFTPTNVPCNEEQNMSITFKNVGVDATTGTTNVVLSCDDPRLTFSDNTGSFGVLAANATITLTDEFAYTVAAGVEDNTKITINVAATCGSETWTSTAKITVGAPIIEFTGMQWAGVYEPGGTYPIVVNFHNGGHYHASNAEVAIASTSSYVSFENETCAVGLIDVDGDGMAVFYITIAESCPTTEFIPLTFTLTADNGVTATGEGILKNTCNVVFTLVDSYGDGWNGGYLTVAFSDGTQSQQLNLSSGSSATYTLEIGAGVHVTVSFTPGNYVSECSFFIAYEDGDEIYSCPQSSSGPSTGVHCEFDVNCAGDAPVILDPVQNLTAEVEFNNITLAWEAPATGTPTGYIIKRDGAEIAEVTELTYTDAELAWETTYTYNVIAKYDEGNSVPAVVTAATGVDAVDENVASFGIYPNPAETVVYIETNAYSYEYQMINSVGQVVISGNAEGNVELNVSGLNGGVYFLKVIANGNSEIKKVVIK